MIRDTDFDVVGFVDVVRKDIKEHKKGVVGVWGIEQATEIIIGKIIMDEYNSRLSQGQRESA